MKYCVSPYQTKRWLTREVKVGSIGVGGNNPLRLQSMTTSPTDDVEETTQQIVKLADSGCDIVRVTVQGKKEAFACEKIKNLLLQKGYTIPLVADIHFFPPAAEVVADFVDKVRINPGNYLDKRATFKQMSYTDEAYAAELLRLEDHFIPLLQKCKQRRIALRIGTNHGSLSDRIMNRFGDTPYGMVESAFEYARVCRKHDFHDIIFSMKASNPLVMIQAYRLLVAEQMKLGWNYPLHLGVTEAGEGEDGRVKSGIGMGSLLLDGIGDTIRVSLTEDPWFEIDPCKRLRHVAEEYAKQSYPEFTESGRDVFALQKRPLSYRKSFTIHAEGCVGLIGGDKVDYPIDFTIKTKDLPIAPEKETLQIFQEELIPLKDLCKDSYSVQMKFDHADRQLSSKRHFVLVTDESVEQWKTLSQKKWDAIFFKPQGSRVHHARHFFSEIKKNKIQSPVILWMDYSTISKEDLVIWASAEVGALFADHLGEGLLLEGSFPAEDLARLSFAILQGCRKRMIKTDFISCPSCGRTLFHLQEVSERIRKRTDHLPGVKIAIMGCIVNGPGEMADADFGYVGSKVGKVDLYVGKECVERSIEESMAVDRLIALIREQGKWIDPIQT